MGKILPGEFVVVVTLAKKDSGQKCKFQVQAVQVLPGEDADILCNAEHLKKLAPSRFFETVLKASVEVMIFSELFALTLVLCSLLVVVVVTDTGRYFLL